MSWRPSIGRALRLALPIALTLSACAFEGAPRGSDQSGSTGPPEDGGLVQTSGTPTPEPSTALSETSCHGTGYFDELPAGAACWIEIATDLDTPIRVSYTVPASGWAAFIGTFKDVGEGEDLQRVSVLIADIRNVTVDACENQISARPPVGPSVENLASALALLPPFEVSSPPEAVTVYGYSGTHLQLRVPLGQPFGNEPGSFIGCDDTRLASWIAPPLSFAFYGYATPGDTEDFWILDVDGTRVVIAAIASPNASDELIAERQAIIDSIVIDR